MARVVLVDHVLFPLGVLSESGKWRVTQTMRRCSHSLQTTEGVLPSPSPRKFCRMIRKSQEGCTRKLPCRQIDAAQVGRLFQGFGVGRA